MSVIKDRYDRLELSDEKKAELKRTLSESFPEYAETKIGRTEVIIMENEKITNNAGRVKVRSKFGVGVAAAAAAALLLTVGISAASRIDVGTSPAGEQTEYNGAQSGYIDDRESSYTQQAKAVYNCMAVVFADLDTMGYSYEHLVGSEGFTITTEDILEARTNETVLGEDKEIQAQELAAYLDDTAKKDGLDLGEIDLEIDFSYWKYSAVYFVFVYPDDSHESFYSYPAYDTEGLEPEFYVDENDYEAQAAAVYETMSEIVADLELWGEDVRFDGDTITRDTIFVAKDAEKKVVLYGDESADENEVGEDYPDRHSMILGDLDGKYNELMIASMFAERLKTKYGLYAEELEFKVEFDPSIDPAAGVTVLAAYVYPDESHETFYRCPEDSEELSDMASQDPITTDTVTTTVTYDPSEPIPQTSEDMLS